jgi:hypothetical protein
MGSVTDPDAAAARSYADAGPFCIASRRNIKLQGTTTAQSAAAETTDAAQNFTVHLTVTRPMGSGDGARQAPFPVVLFLNGFQVHT